MLRSIMERRLPPISLRLRSAESTRRARELLHRLAEDELRQRRIKWRATKCLIELKAMSAAAAAQVEKMLPSERTRWETECKKFASFLEKIKARGM